MDHRPLGRLDPERFPTRAPPRVDQRALDAVRTDIRTYALDEHFPRVRQLLTQLERHPREQDLRQLVDIVTPYVTYHEQEHPFAIAPRGVLAQGAIPVLTQLVDQQELQISPEELAQGGILIIGSSGTGKSTLLLQVTEEVLRRGFSAWIIDPKDDARYLVRNHPDLLVLDAHAPINLLAQPPYLSRAEHLANVEESIARAMYGGQTVRAILHEALTLNYERVPDPTFLDLITTLEAMPRKGDTYQRVDAIRNTLQRLRRLIERYPGLATRGGIRPHELCTHSLLIPILEYSDLEDALLTYLTRVLFHHHRAHRITHLTHLIAIDEALLAVRDDHQRIGGNPLTELHAMTREYGIAWAISVNSMHLTDAQLRNNAYLQIALNLHSSDDVALVARTFGFTRDEAEYHRIRLTRGQAIARLGDRWRRPVLCTFTPSTEEKHVDSATWEEACRRIARLVPETSTPPATPAHSAAREGKESWPPPSQAPTATASREQPTRATDSTPANAPASSAQVTSAEHSYNATSPNARQEEIPPNALVDLGIVSNRSEKATSPNALRSRVALNPHATALLQDVGDHPFTLCTKAYRRCELLLAQGDRARAQLERLTLLCATRVTCGRGRGKTGISLNLTAAGWKGRTPVKGLRGGSSVQHSFCVFELSRRIPGSTIEEYLGAKPVDLCIPFNTEWHERFYRAITLLTGRTPHLEDGDIIALEVEISAPSRSSVTNAEKDAAAGVALTVLAIADRHPERRALILPSNSVVVDVYALLDALRTTEDR